MPLIDTCPSMVQEHDPDGPRNRDPDLTCQFTRNADAVLSHIGECGTFAARN